MTGRLGDPKLALFLALAIVLAIAGLLAALQALGPSPVPPSTVTATLQIESTDWNLSYRATTTNNTVLGFLLEAADTQGFSVHWTLNELYQAAYIDAINGVPDGAGGLFWQYWVNGAYGQVGADRYMLADGDAVLWRHAPYPPGDVR